jgi:hypothetical protein
MGVIHHTEHDGQKASRRSDGEIEQKYFFAVWVQRLDESPATWSCESYHTRRDLAFKAASAAWPVDRFRYTVAPVTAEIKLTKRQKERLAQRGGNDAA